MLHSPLTFRFCHARVMCVVLIMIMAFWMGCASKKQSSKNFSFNISEEVEKAAKSQREFNKKMESNERYQHEKAGESFLKQKKYNEAIREFDAAIKLDPSTQTVYVKKGIAQYRRRRPQEAVANFDKAIKLNKRGKGWLWYPLFHKGIALGSLGKNKESVVALSASIDIKPTADSYFWRAMAYVQMNQRDKASWDVEAGLKLRPGDKRLLAVSRKLK